MPPEVEGMFAAMLLAISIVALSQFALYYWRSILAGVAAQPVSGRVLEAARVENGTVSANDFDTFAGLHDLTPDLQLNAESLGLVRYYVRAIEAIETLFASVPAVAAWGQRERAVCARYVAVQIDRRLQANLELAASLRSC
jgi:hypothetical protein